MAQSKPFFECHRFFHLVSFLANTSFVDLSRSLSLSYFHHDRYRDGFFFLRKHPCLALFSRKKKQGSFCPQPFSCFTKSPTSRSIFLVDGSLSSFAKRMGSFRHKLGSPWLLSSRQCECTYPVAFSFGKEREKTSSFFE